MSPTYYIVFTAIAAAGVLLQAVVLLGILIAIRRSSGKLHETLDEVKAKALPAIELAYSLLEDVSPRLKTATRNLAEVSEVLRGQAGHMNATVESLLDKTNAQIGRVDEMVTNLLNAAGQASKAVDNVIGLPARRLSGVLHGVRVGLDVLVGGRKSSEPPPVPKGTVSGEPAAAAAAPVSAEQQATAAQKPA